MFNISQKRFIKFCTVGFSGVIVNEGFLFLLTEKLGLFYLLSSIIAIELSLINNFILNDLWTFRDRRKNGKTTLFQRVMTWHVARSLTIFVNLSILWMLTTLGIHYLVSNFVGIIVATILAYVLSLKAVWKA